MVSSSAQRIYLKSTQNQKSAQLSLHDTCPQAAAPNFGTDFLGQTLSLVQEEVRGCCKDENRSLNQRASTTFTSYDPGELSKEKNDTTKVI